MEGGVVYMTGEVLQLSGSVNAEGALCGVLWL